MKNILYTVLLLLATATATAQSQDQNYVKTTTYNDSDTTAVASKTVQVTYLDGLGRPIQQLAAKQSATGKDILTHIEYDIFGRPAKDYLPYPSTTSTMAFADPATLSLATQTYYQSVYGESNPYSEKKLETSPLNRVLQQAAPGNSWTLGSGHEIKIDYLANGLNEVKLYKATAQWQGSQGLYLPTLTLAAGAPGYYTASQLYKTVTKDENWTSGNPHTVEEFKDKEGKLLLKRTYAATLVEGTPVQERLDTYYVYDQFGNLSFVLPPDVSTIAQSQLDGLCYQYRYDRLNRLVEKKLPGKQWEFIIYDRLDRVVATGPAYSPFPDLSTAPGWLITKYDDFNRVCYTAWMYSSTVTSADRKLLQDDRDAAKTFSETKLPNASDTTVNGVAFRYTTLAWPTGGYHVLTVNYYDDYNFPDAPTDFTDFEQQPVYYNLTKKPKGLPTGYWFRALEASTAYNATKTYVFYDTKGRALQEYSKNYLSGHTQTYSKLDFSGKVLYKITSHKRQDSDPVLEIREDFTYSDQNRLLTHTHQIDGGAVQLLASNVYDELGQLVNKSVGGLDTSGNYPLQKVGYRYNIRGWLKEINSVGDLLQPGDPDDLFAFKINYDTVENSTNYVGQALFNGNISETQWKTSDNILRKYGYSYDPANRLTNAIYIKDGMKTESYNEALQYDRNGNIIWLQRNGGLDASSGSTLQIDDLSYGYEHNQLVYVEDSSGNPQGFKDGVSDYPEYLYDPNGNMTMDANKGILEITYNHLNLPMKINFSANSNKIEYLYDANGGKLKKTITEGGVPTAETEYLSGFQYTFSPQSLGLLVPVLQFFPTAEGYVKLNEGKRGTYFSYVFNLTDHLGNVRIGFEDLDGDGVISPTSEVLEENNYYPFGMKHEGYNSVLNQWTNKYKFQGQERQDELELNWDSFKWRNYDYAIGRFMSIDPLAEDYPYNSTYAFQENKIGMGRELEGLELVERVKDKANEFYVNSGLKHAADWFGDLFTPSAPQKLEPTSHKDMETTMTSKKGGGENPKSDGKTGGNTDAGPIIDAAPGQQKSGNKYGNKKDALTYTKDILSGEKKGEKAAGGVQDVIKENSNNIDKPKDTLFSIKAVNGGNTVYSSAVGKKAADKAIEDAKKNGATATKQVQAIISE